jgi:septal ring factor EnvC (AmiA/AmiB activator)
MLKMSSLLLLLAFVVSIVFIAGCGPKGAPQEMLDELEELKAATEACEAKVKENESRMKEMEAEITMKESRIEMLTQERDELKAKLGIVK